jgi:hypothetical protein
LAKQVAARKLEARPSKARGGAKDKRAAVRRSQEEAESSTPCQATEGLVENMSRPSTEKSEEEAESPSPEKAPEPTRPKKRTEPSAERLEKENDRPKRMMLSQDVDKTASQAAPRAKVAKKRSLGEEKEKTEATLKAGWESEVMTLLFSQTKAIATQAFETFQSPAEFVEVEGYAIDPGTMTEEVSFELPMILGCAMEEALRRLRKRSLGKSTTISTVLDRLEAIFKMQSFLSWLYKERVEDIRDGGPLGEYLFYVFYRVQYLKLVTCVFSLLRTGA